MAKLSDFGSAISSASITTHSQGYTPRYSPPEVLVSESRPSFASDVYSAGMVIYEVLEGMLTVACSPR